MVGAPGYVDNPLVRLLLGHLLDYADKMLERSPLALVQD